MSTTRLPRVLRARGADRVRQRCGYCLTSELITGIPMEIDHLLPEVLGGATSDDNLWLACSACNGARGDRVAARDPLTSACVAVYNFSVQ